MSSETTQGVRVDYDGDGPIPPASSYWKQDGIWFAVTPSGLLANLANHNPVEHDDGTITANPSILVKGGGGSSWHGYPERGVWREC